MPRSEIDDIAAATEERDRDGSRRGRSGPGPAARTRCGRSRTGPPCRRRASSCIAPAARLALGPTPSRRGCRCRRRARSCRACAGHGAHAAVPRDSRSISTLGREAAPEAPARGPAGRSPTAAPGRPSPRAASAIARCAAGSSTIAMASRRAVASKSASSMSRRRRPRARTAAFAFWWPAACGIRHDDHRQAEGRGLGQGRGAGPDRPEVGRGECRQHLVAEERRWSVRGRRPRAGPRARRARRRSRRRP